MLRISACVYIYIYNVNLWTNECSQQTTDTLRTQNGAAAQFCHVVVSQSTMFRSSDLRQPQEVDRVHLDEQHPGDLAVPRLHPC